MGNLIAVLLLFFTNFIFSQNQVQWNTSVEAVSDSTYTLIIEADILENWHLYAVNQPEDEEPMINPTTFTFQGEGVDFKIIGEIEEGEPITEMDKVLEQRLSYFADKAVFKQQIQVLNPNLKSIIGDVAYQACDDKQCIFDQYDLGFSLDGKAVVIDKEVDAKSLDLAQSLELPLTNTELLKTNHHSDSSSSSGLFNLFVLGFLGGLIALLTPCVFPMIPLTVSFFTKQSSNKRKGISNAILYGVFIIVIY